MWNWACALVMFSFSVHPWAASYKGSELSGLGRASHISSCLLITLNIICDCPNWVVFTLRLVSDKHTTAIVSGGSDSGSL